MALFFFNTKRRTTASSWFFVLYAAQNSSLKDIMRRVGWGRLSPPCRQVEDDLVCGTLFSRPPAANWLFLGCSLVLHLVTFLRFSSAVLSVAASFHDLLGAGKVVTFTPNTSLLSSWESLAPHLSVMEATGCPLKCSKLLYLYKSKSVIYWWITKL